MTWDLRGKTVFITGAARGIGAETARRAAAAGANVALVGLEPEELQRVAAQCGSNAAAFECDVTDWDALERAVQGTVDRFGGIDVVMANAGISPAGMTRSIDQRAFERTVEINLFGVWRTVRTCLPHVIERKGYVLVTASLAALSLPAVTPPNLRKSFSLISAALPTPTTIRRSALIPSGAGISSVEPLLPLNWLAAAARLTVSDAFPSAFRVASPNFNASSQNTTRTPRGAVEKATKPTLTASDIGNPPEFRAVLRGRNRPGFMELFSR